MSKEVECKKCGSTDINTHYVDEFKWYDFAHRGHEMHDDWPEADFMFHRCRHCDYVWWSWPSDRKEK